MEDNTITLYDGKQKTTPQQRVQIFMDAVCNGSLPLVVPMDANEFISYLEWILKIVGKDGEQHLPQAWIKAYGKVENGK